MSDLIARLRDRSGFVERGPMALMQHCEEAAAELERLAKENAALRAFIQESADELCSYGDNCPPFVKTNHGRCDPCKARAALDSARAKESGDG